MKYELKKWADPNANPPHEAFLPRAQAQARPKRHRHEPNPEEPPAMLRSSSQPTIAGGAAPPQQPALFGRPPQQPTVFGRPQPSQAPSPGLLDFDFGAAAAPVTATQQQQQTGNDRAALMALVQTTPTAVGNPTSLRQLIGGPQYAPRPTVPSMPLPGPALGIRPPQQQFPVGPRPPKSASTDPFGFPF
jgi:hypothetical protein